MTDQEKAEHLDCPDAGCSHIKKLEDVARYGLLAYRDLRDGTVLVVRPLTLGRARLVRGVWSETGIEHATAWCMSSPAEAIQAFLQWPEEPTGWNRKMLPSGENVYPDRQNDP